MIQRTTILLADLLPDVTGHAMAKDVMGKLVHANVAAPVAVVLQSEQVLLPARSHEAAHTAGPLVTREAVVFVQRFALVLAPFRQVGRNLVAADNVQLGAGSLQLDSHARQVAEHHRKPVARGEQSLVHDVGRCLDEDALVVEAFGIKALLRGVHNRDGGVHGGGGVSPSS